MRRIGVSAMTEQDREAFALLMLGIGETFGEPVSEARMEIYFRALSDLTLEQLQIASNVHANSSRFFPKPVELREAICGAVEDRAEIAWANVQALVRRHGYWADPASIHWPDEVTEHAAMKLYGGWKALCEFLPNSGPEMLGTAKLFKAHYAAVSRQVEREALPPSRQEAKARLVDLTAELRKRGLPTGAL
jgi:hypothetical protein